MSPNLHPNQQPVHVMRGLAAIASTGKRALMLLAFACLSLPLFAQPAATDRPALLNTTQLDQQPWFYSLDSALANPEKVYKLSLTDQKIKVLPEEFGTLKNLQVLNMSNCKLKAIPTSIKECKNIQTMSLYGNKIRVIPVEMRELKQLEILYLGKNRILEIPSWMSVLTKMRRLDISRNALTPADVDNARRMFPKADVTF